VQTPDRTAPEVAVLTDNADDGPNYPERVRNPIKKVASKRNMQRFRWARELKNWEAGGGGMVWQGPGEGRRLE